MSGDDGIGADVLAELRAAVEAVPAVETAIPLLRHEAKLDRARHLGDTERQESAGPKADVENSTVLAEAFGGELVLEPGYPTTLQEALRLAAELAPEKGTRYVSADGSEVFQSYPQLLSDAQSVLSGLRETGIQPGESVLFQFASNKNFVTAFWACVLGGYLPTPVGAAPGYDRDNAVTQKLRNAWELLGKPLILTDERLADAVRKLPSLWGVEDVRVAAVEELAGAEDTDWFPATPDSPVVHLLTSGSTGVPKCVRHPSRTILARTKATALANGFDENDVALNWMPLDHVGGIVMYNVRDVILRCQHVNAEIEAFLSEPLRWLDWTDRYGATNTWAPNFAFALVNEQAAAMKGRTWDLSTLRHICNAGEAVVSRTAERFIELLRPHGLPNGAMRPCWGMSETSSGVTYSTMPADDPVEGRLWVDKDSLAGPLRLLDAGDPEAITFTEVGPPIPGVRLRIVDHENIVVPEDQVGRLQITGPTIMNGYFRNDEANAEAFTEDGWFNTGDLAFLHEGRLTITGREKDLIIIQGANYLNYDLESIVEQVDGTEVTYVAVCGYSGAGNDTDKLVVFFVPTDDDVHTTIAAVKARLAQEIGLQPDLVIPVERERFPKTNSGKIQRNQLVTDLDNGAFDEWLRELEIAEESESTLPAWFFERTWISSASQVAGALPPGPWLVFDADGLAVRLAAHPDVPELIVVAEGEDYVQVLGERRVGAVLHGWSLTDNDLESGALSVAGVLRTLAAQGSQASLLVLTGNGLWARSGDGVDVLKSTLPGLVRTAAMERVLPLVRQVDVDSANCADAIVAELSSPDGEDLVAYRDGKRLVARLRPVSLGDADEQPAALKAGGRYLLTGGLGGIAYEIAEYLLAAYQAKLVLVGRSEVDENGDDEKAERLADLKMLGEVEYHAVDVSDADALRAALSTVELDGVLHLAGADVSHQWSSLEDHAVANETTEGYLDAYRAKVNGTLAIAELLRDRPDTLLVLFSSVNGDFGGSSFAAYSSANSFLNGFADHWGRELGRPVHCLAWSMWTGIGMNQGSPAAAAASRGFRSISGAQGLASFLTALSLDRVHLLIGLDGRNEHIVRVLDPGELRAAEVIVAYTGTAGAQDVRAAVSAVARGVPVPVRYLAVPDFPVGADGSIDAEQLLADAVAELARGGRRYVAPATDLERKLAVLWREVLGSGEVGREDRFFDLGGSSLRAAQLVARINGTVSSRMSVHHLYEHPTIGQLAELLEQS
ncbi:SDR family NAD(P)-dependent oxidoreductase [Allokutzneria sp. A3M-2-11 16]|uniref:non-ribosomal peptide synthetase n=1 Tax=Allokutzneria sp. A3M-2-11 16 TaxID=2962043 RepID=UPI0020B6B993|nr:non-ribosomal peptide synthetase [Allokutzneria sp. A3M-2-11 16]MCP3804558.1 SDR family NAD(P)-dependent oxidoreductase [Allokutzneria sp. A3M-2-11 16]